MAKLSPLARDALGIALFTVTLAGVGRGPEPDDLGSERDRAVVSIPGDMLETDED